MAPTTIHLPAQARRATQNAVPYKKRVLIYFITGNPGLIGFYEVFLHSLRALIDEKPRNSEIAYDIRGRNLFGFDDSEHEAFDETDSSLSLLSASQSPSESQSQSQGQGQGQGQDHGHGHGQRRSQSQSRSSPNQSQSAPYDLEAQIQAVYEEIAAQRWMSADDGQPRTYDHVYLMGHSLGAYISVEIMSRHARDPVEPFAAHLRIPHAMLLFPTLTYLAKSPQGKKVTKLLRLLPSLPAQGQLLAKTMITVFPPPALHFLLTRILGYSSQTARVTAQWLRSRDGVREAVYLGLSELQHIREERWSDDVWEVTKGENEDNERLAGLADSTRTGSGHGYGHSHGHGHGHGHGDGADDVAGEEPGDGTAHGGPEKRPKVYIFFGKNDYWVANKWRDAFIENRRGGRTSIEIDTKDICHAFCLNEETSFIVAKKVRGWIDDTERKRGSSSA